MIEIKKQRALQSRTYCRLIEIIKSLPSSGVTRLTKGKGRLGLGASDSGQGRCDMYIAQIKSEE